MALYHKYRPQKFSEVCGQEHILKTITNQITAGKTAHAYLFSGPRGIGKTTTARLLAKALNCTARKDDSSEPCNECTSCAEISTSRAIDVVEIDAASHTGVDNVREHIIDSAQTRPAKAKHKIFIVDEAHMLSTSAFNALLKTLEEPPSYVVFILATTELHKLPETIISRCQRFDFKRLSSEALKNQLEKIAKLEGVVIAPEVVQKIIHKSDGCDRDAVSILDQLLSSGEKEITNEFAQLVLPSSTQQESWGLITHILNQDASASLVQLHEIVNAGTNAHQLADDLLHLLRLLIIAKANDRILDSYDLNDSIKKEFIVAKEKISSPKLIQLIDLLLKRRAEIKSSPLPQLPLELLLVEWCTEEVKTGIASPPQAEKKTLIEVIEQPKIPPVVSEAPQEKIIADEPKQIASNSGAITIENARKALAICAEKIGLDSPSLASMLRQATVKSVKNDILSIEVPFKFNKDKLESPVCRKKIMDTLSEYLQTAVTLDIQASESVAPDAQLNDLAAAFGGEII